MKKPSKPYSARRAAPSFLDPQYFIILCHAAETRFKVGQVFWLTATNLLSAPSHLIQIKQWLPADFVTDYSGGTAPEFHGIPY